MPDTVRVLVLALLVGVAQPTAAQDRRAYERRVDTLREMATAAHQAVLEQAERLKPKIPLDTVRFGSMRVLAEPALVGIARVVAPRVLDSVKAIVGQRDALAQRASYVLRMDTRFPRAIRGARAEPDVALTTLLPTGAQVRGWTMPRDTGEIERALRYAVLHDIFVASDRRFFGWMGSVVPTDTVHTSEWARQRLLLVSSPTAVGLRCFRGDAAACLKALQLTPVADPATEWFDARTRRRLVSENRQAALGLSARATGDCEAGSDSACLVLVRQLPVTARDPLHAAAHAGVVKLAMAKGGAGALERMLAPDQTIPERLAAGANMPVEALVREWQTRVARTPGQARDFTPGVAFLSLGWALVFGALSLRSSRWR